MGGTDSVRVGIRMESQQDDERAVTEYTGMLFRKPQALYLKYEETDENEGRSSVTVRYDGHELRIVRHGQVEGEQSFVEGQRRQGSYHLQSMRLGLETETAQLRLTEGGAGQLPIQLEWRYDLWVNEQWTGRFHLRLHIREDES